MTRRNVVVVAVVALLYWFGVGVHAYDPNCDELPLLIQHTNIAQVTYAAAQTAENVTKQRFGSKVEGTTSDSFQHSLWNALIVRNVYQNPSLQGGTWDVSTIQSSVLWAKTYTDAYECTSNRSCCPANLERNRQMDLHNNYVGRNLVIDNSTPSLLSAEQYAQLLYDKTSTARWFNPQTPFAAWCTDLHTLAVYSPTPAGVDQYESDDCAQVAVSLTALPVTQSHTFHNSLDEDWVTWCAEGGSSIEVTTSCTNPSQCRTSLTLYESDGTTVLTSGDGSISGFTMTTDKTVLLKIWNKNSVTNPAQSNYTVSIQGLVADSCTTSATTGVVGSTTGMPSTTGVYQVPVCPYPTCQSADNEEPLPWGPITSRQMQMTVQYTQPYLAYKLDLLENGTPNGLGYTVELRSLTEMSTGRQACQSIENPPPFDLTLHSKTALYGANNVMRNVNVTGTFANCAKLEASNFLYEGSTTVEYAGQPLVLPDDSFKFALNVSEWPFQDPQNRIQIMVRIITNADLLNHEFQFDDLGNIQKIVIYSAQNHTWTFRFLPNAIVDNQVVACSTRLVPVQLDPLIAEFVLDCPAFSQYLYYDPDFSVLLGGKRGDAEPTNEGDEVGISSDNIGALSSTTVIGIAAGCAVAVVVAAIVVGLVLARRRKALMMRRFLRSPHGAQSGVSSDVTMSSGSAVE